MRRGATAAFAVLVAIAAAALPASPAAAKVATPNAAARELAAEVCEEMVGDAAVGAAGEALVIPQQGAWDGSRYTCPYQFDGGTLAVNVDVFKSVAAAKHGFSKVRAKAKDRTRLYGIGQQAFQADDLTLVSRKDNFVLTVDPTALPDRLNRDHIVWATTLAVFDCW
jgi:hypothetical protein